MLLEPGSTCQRRRPGRCASANIQKRGARALAHVRCALRRQTRRARQCGGPGAGDARALAAIQVAAGRAGTYAGLCFSVRTLPIRCWGAHAGGPGSQEPRSRQRCCSSKLQWAAAPRRCELRRRSADEPLEFGAHLHANYCSRHPPSEPEEKYSPRRSSVHRRAAPNFVHLVR